MNDLHASFAALFKRAACYAPVADLDAELLRLRLEKRDPQEVNVAIQLGQADMREKPVIIGDLTELMNFAIA